MIKFYSKVKKIEHKERIIRVRKIGPGKDDIKTETEEMGWFMLLDGSWESLYVGETRPEGLNEGDEVEVLIQRKS